MPETSPEARASKSRVNPWMLTFRDAELERKFRSSWLDGTRIQNLFWELGAIVYYLSMTVALQAVLPADEQYMIELRYGLGLPMIILSTLPLLLHPQLKSFSAAFFSIAVIIIFGISCFQLRVAQPPDDFLFLFDMTVVFIFAQHCNRSFFVQNVFLVSVLSLTAGVTVYGFGGSDLATNVPFAPFVLTLAGIATIGIFASYTREFVVRRNYLTERRLRAEKTRAEQLSLDAAQALEAKSRFLAIVGHELRTPLNAIIGFSELVLSGVTREGRPDKTRAYVGDIHQSGRHLLGLVESVLDYTEAGAGKIRINAEVVAPIDLINNVCADVARSLNTRHQTALVDVDDDVPELSVDVRLVSQCLASLLSNASKFSAVGSDIRCAARWASDGKIEITVTDQGQGLGEANTELLFDPFAQADDGPTRRTEGLGIGLPLTRALMRAHDGDVRLATRAGVGTVATLIFPMDRIVHQATKVQPALL
ncbi:MAG: HAMP domain-containing sensor histidine kinase [Minwuia sp.]|nr:HAMP domain-containing sensor histidine kinase [Minwuia sp.]